ncbi:MAG: hypothetical protein BCV62_20815 [Pseudomonas sp. K35]|nr:MAG: hypothetical protein BCV62_20815 [Pseudomonas sp. K35]
MPTGGFGPGFGFGPFIHGSDEFGRVIERWVMLIHHDLCQQRSYWSVVIQRILQLLFDDVANHAFGFSPQHIQRIGLVRFVGSALQSQKPHLRAVAMGNDQIMASPYDGR